MLGSTVLEVAIGLALVFFFLSVLSSALCEAIAGFTALRSKTLSLGIQRLLGGQLAGQIHQNPLVKSLCSKDGEAPSYIPARTFAIALVDELFKIAADREGAAPGDAAEPKPAAGDPVAAFVDQPLSSAASSVRLDGARSEQKQIDALRAAASGKGALGVLLSDAAITDVEKARDAIARWFDEGMERTGGWYKRQAHLRLSVLALLLTVIIDVDALRVGNALASDATLRAAIVATGEGRVKTPNGGADEMTPLTRAVAIQQELAQLRLPIARWSWMNAAHPTPPASLSTRFDWFLMRARESFFGWLLTALAVSLGAPFWFDVLGKLVNLRAAGKVPEPEKAKKDAAPQKA